LALDGGEWSASCPGLCTPEKEPLAITAHTHKMILIVKGT